MCTSESVANTSPPGATATQRIRLKPPSANTFAENPFGTVSDAPSGCGTTDGGLRTSGVANGLGSASGLTWCCWAASAEVNATTAPPTTRNCLVIAPCEPVNL